MKLSGLKCPFWFSPQSTVNVPVDASPCSLGFLTFAFTLVMSTKNDGLAASALALVGLPAVLATTNAATAIARPVPAVAIFVLREIRCRPFGRAIDFSPRSGFWPGEDAKGDAWGKTSVGGRARQWGIRAGWLRTFNRGPFVT